MRFNIEIDCTPEEARSFLGLPDVGPMQKLVLDAMQQRLLDLVTHTDPKALLEQWVPMGLKGLEQLPGLWAQMAATATGFPKPKGGDR
jgi:hypothetical protein